VLPPWLQFLLSGIVALYALFRFRMFFIPERRYETLRDRGMMYRIPRRQHLVTGVVFLLLAAWLLAGGLGYNPLS